MIGPSPTVHWNAIRGVIFDMDGTLYDQRLVRIKIALELIIHTLTTKFGWRDAMVVKHFRSNREALANHRTANISSVQFRATAKYFQLEEELVNQIIHYWMEIRPLPFLNASKFADLDDFFSALKARGIRVGIFSDYPVKEKLAVLGLEADALCSSTQSDVDVLKPDSAGLLKVISMMGLHREHCLMIGDRLDRDGLCAKEVGVQFLLREGRHFYTRLLANVKAS